jgi:hypothetical protein
MDRPRARRCPECGGHFRLVRSDAVYCCRAHQQRAWRRREREKLDRAAESLAQQQLEARARSIVEGLGIIGALPAD